MGTVHPFGRNSFSHLRFLQLSCFQCVCVYLCWQSVNLALKLEHFYYKVLKVAGSLVTCTFKFAALSKGFLECILKCTMNSQKRYGNHIQQSILAID